MQWCEAPYLPNYLLKASTDNFHDIGAIARQLEYATWGEKAMKGRLNQ